MHDERQSREKRAWMMMTMGRDLIWVDLDREQEVRQMSEQDEGEAWTFYEQSLVEKQQEIVKCWKH